MQTVAIIEPIALLLILGAVFWYIRSNKEKEQEKELRTKQIAATERLCAAAGSMEKMSESLADIPKLMQGNIKVGQAMVAEIGKFRIATQKFQSLIQRPEDPRQALTEATEEGATTAFELANLLSGNPSLTMEEAADKVKAELEHRAMFSSVSLDSE